MKVKFGNRENQCVITEDGREVWLSRACAVVAQVCLYNTEDQTWYVLLGKRGTGTPNFQGYWCFPCGYLDWDESLTQGMIREVWEECGLYLPDLSAHSSYLYSDSPCVRGSLDVSDTPWNISDKPYSTTQNVSLHFAVICQWKNDDFPSLSNRYCEPNEVDDLKWCSVEEAKKMDLAFNHNQQLLLLLDEKNSEFKKVEAL